MPPSVHLIVFDLDGTLVDSVPDLAAAANYALRRLGLPEQSLESHRRLLGQGEKNFVRRFLGPEHQHLFDQALSLYLEHYSRNLARGTRVYSGVRETLGRLFPLKMAVLTNKREDLAQGVVEALGLAGFFRAVRGGDSYGVLKPSPEGLRRLISELGAKPGRTLMVGDKPEDVLTGRGAGTLTAAVASGYGDPNTLAAASPDFLIDHLPRLLDLLDL